MSDQIVTNATPEPAAPQAQPQNVQPTATTPVQTGGKTFSEDQVEQIIKERLDRERQKREKAAEEAARKAAEDAAKQNQEWQKLAEQRERELAELQTQLKARELAELKRTIAERVGLPPSLAARLVGDDEKALETDAKALLETLPKPEPPVEKPKQPGVNPAMPGANGTQGITPAQQRERIYGARTNPWSVDTAKTHGGGAIYRETKE